VWFEFKSDLLGKGLVNGIPTRIPARDGGCGSAIAPIESIHIQIVVVSRGIGAGDASG
jgi:hypothetical protein